MAAKELVDAVPALVPYLRARPQLSDEQAAGYSYGQVLKYAGTAGRETVDPWDPLSDPLATGAALKPDYVVDGTAKADGKTVFNTVQSAVNAAVAGDATAQRKDRLYILVRPGTYHELLYVPDSSTPITIYGGSGDSSATRISANLDAGIPGRRYAEKFGGQFAAVDARIAAMFASLKDRAAVGTPGSTIVWIKNHGFQAKNITFENAFNKDRGDWIAENDERVVQRQAVALTVDGADKVQFENVRFIGFQDTLFLKTSAPGVTARSFFHKSYVEGDMDFIFGDGTAYFHRSEIKSLGDRRASFLIAPSTHYQSRFGFVFNDCDFTHDNSPNALTGTFKLARQWFRGQRCTPFGTVTVPPGYACRFGESDTYDAPTGTISKATLENVGKTVIVNSRIGAHIDKAQPWADWNVDGTRSHRPVQYDSDDYWANLSSVRIDPVAQMGYAAKKSPAEPFLAEHRNSFP
jgi:pectin methylesterase-like acyl-CoA thioesterase